MLLLILTILIFKSIIHHSNTSHVTINRPGIEFLTLLVKIQIHLMLLLILSDLAGTEDGKHSNTSHVTINPIIFKVVV